MYVTMQRTQPINLQFLLFLVTVLTNKLFILTILFCSVVAVFINDYLTVQSI